MLAFHNDPAIKEKYIARVRAHKAADHLIRGTGWDNGRGCAVGCTLEKYEHQAYETELQIPAQLAYLEDFVFERLPIVVYHITRGTCILVFPMTRKNAKRVAGVAAALDNLIPYAIAQYQAGQIADVKEMLCSELGTKVAA